MGMEYQWYLSGEMEVSSFYVSDGLVQMMQNGNSLL